MVYKLNNIEFYLGALPVENPEEVDVLDTSSPYQFLLTKKGHSRRLDVIMYNVDGNDKLRLFNIKSNFSYYIPKYENGIIKDYCVSYDKNEDWFFGKLNEKMKPTNLRGVRQYTFIRSLIGLPREVNEGHYEFYSLDNNKNVHKTSIDFKYNSFKNSINFKVDYDNKIRVKLDTDGYYIMRGLSASGSRLSQKGNLLKEEDSTLYLDKDIPIKIYIKK